VDTLKETTTICIYMQSNLPILFISLCEVRYSFYNSFFIELKTHKSIIYKLDLRLLLLMLLQIFQFYLRKTKR
jgi:hypothetical protein